MTPEAARTLVLRRADGATLQQLGDEDRLSRERMRQKLNEARRILALAEYHPVIPTGRFERDPVAWLEVAMDLGRLLDDTDRKSEVIRAELVRAQAKDWQRRAEERDRQWAEERRQDAAEKSAYYKQRASVTRRRYEAYDKIQNLGEYDKRMRGLCEGCWRFVVLPVHAWWRDYEGKRLRCPCGAVHRVQRVRRWRLVLREQEITGRAFP